MEQQPTEAGSPVIDMLMAHRSVRRFTGERLGDGVLERLVEAGTRASTSSNMQAYTVIDVAESARKKQLAELCANQVQIHQSAAFLVFCADLHKLMLACGVSGTETEAAGEAEALLIAVIDTALLMQNVAVAAESLGLGICMIGAIRNHPFDVAERLSLPPHVVAVSGLCIGEPAEDGEVKPRLPLAATLHRETYRADEELLEYMRAYDETQSQWYAERDMHPRDPRWTAVMSHRLPGVESRTDVGRFLQAAGFLSRLRGATQGDVHSPGAGPCAR